MATVVFSLPEANLWRWANNLRLANGRLIFGKVRCIADIHIFVLLTLRYEKQKYLAIITISHLRVIEWNYPTGRLCKGIFLSKKLKY
jgi:hypothetical protein